MPRNNSESALLSKIRLAIGARDDITLLRINTGVFRGITNPKAVVRSAPNGTPDLIACWKREVDASETRNSDGFTPHTRNFRLTYGQFLAIETKSAKGKLSKAQTDFAAAIENMGGIYILARSVQDVIDVIGREK